MPSKLYKLTVFLWFFMGELTRTTWKMVNNFLFVLRNKNLCSLLKFLKTLDVFPTQKLVSLYTLI